MSDIGRCPRCNRFLIAEQRQGHHCRVSIRKVEEIILDWMNEGVQDENEDVVHVAMGLDGILYRLILCKHNPPHVAKRNFTCEKPNGNYTEPFCISLI